MPFEKKEDINNEELDKDKKFQGKDFYKFINDDLIPFAGHIDTKTVLLKNGEIMQTISVHNYRNSANIRGELVSSIRLAVSNIAKKYHHHSVSFWINNVRSRNVKIVKELIRKNNTGSVFENTLQDNWRDMCFDLNNYDTVCYITIICQCINIRLKPSTLPLMLNKMMVSRKIDSSIKEGLAFIKDVTKEMKSCLARYEIHTLKCHKDQESGIYISEQMQFFSRLLNFDAKKYAMPLAGISQVINSSMFNFDFGSFKAKLDGKERFGAIFTVKDTSTISREAVAKIMNGSYDLVTCEIFHSINSKHATYQYKKQLDIIKDIEEESWVDTGISKKLKLDRLLDEKALFYKNYIGFMLISRTPGGLSAAILDFNERIKDAGIQLGKEDIGIERSFYSFLPGNFRFIKHYSILTHSEICSSAYSYIFDNQNIDYYLDKRPLFLTSTLQSNTYAFGLLEKNPNIFIVGQNRSRRSILTNIISTYSLMHYDWNWYNLEFKSSRGSLMKCIKGYNYIIDGNKKNQTYQLSFFGFDNDPHEREERILECLKVFFEDDKNYPTEQFSDTISGLCKCRSDEEVWIYFDQYISDKPFGPVLKEWLSRKGKYTHMLSFLDEEDVDYNYLETANYTMLLDKINKNNDKSFLIAMVLHNIIQKVYKYNFRSLITIENPFIISRSKVNYDLLQDIINSSKERGSICIIMCDDQDADVVATKTTHFSSEDIKDSFDTQIYFNDSNINEYYEDMYKHPQHEIMAIKKLKNVENSALLKQTDLLLPIKLDFSFINASIVDILYDNATFRDRVSRCMKFYQTEDEDTWVSYFVKRSIKEKENGAPLDDEEFVRKEETPIYKIEEGNREEALAKEIIKSG